MVDVAQLVEPRIVIPAVVGSSPIVHPTLSTLLELLSERALASPSDSMNNARPAGWTSGYRSQDDGPLAQLVEQLTLNQLVVGSIPTRPTNSSLLLNTSGRSQASVV